MISSASARYWFQSSGVSWPFGSFRISKTTLSRRLLIVRSDLLPEAEELRLEPGRVLGHIREVMQVEDHHQVVLERVVHSPIQRFEPAGGKLIVGAFHVPEGVQVDSDVLKTAFFDQFEVFLFEAALLEIFPDGIVADDVHPAAQTLDLLKAGSEF